VHQEVRSRKKLICGPIINKKVYKRAESGEMEKKKKEQLKRESV